MTEGFRTPAIAPPPIRDAVARDSDPSDWLAAHYRKVYDERMHDLPFVNPALAVAAVGFTRLQGDWLGVVITPWFLNLFLLNGGGSLWGDIPAGQRRYLNLPCGTLQFIADDDPELGPYQYCPLIAPVTGLPDMAAAQQAAIDALAAALAVPAATIAPPTPAAAQAAAEEAPKGVSRRGFLRTLTGRR